MHGLDGLLPVTHRLAHRAIKQLLSFCGQHRRRVRFLGGLLIHPLHRAQHIQVPQTRMVECLTTLRVGVAEGPDEKVRRLDARMMALLRRQPGVDKHLARPIGQTLKDHA